MLTFLGVTKSSTFATINCSKKTLSRSVKFILGSHPIASKDNTLFFCLSSISAIFSKIFSLYPLASWGSISTSMLSLSPGGTNPVEGTMMNPPTSSFVILAVFAFSLQQIVITKLPGQAKCPRFRAGLASRRFGFRFLITLPIFLWFVFIFFTSSWLFALFTFAVRYVSTLFCDFPLRFHKLFITQYSKAEWKPAFIGQNQLKLLWSQQLNMPEIQVRSWADLITRISNVDAKVT